ncbi:nucleotide exchange factor GrpE [Desulfonatronovibrio hydrogenovorans]|uniref:nucleotide exchange factor GrpE n=1 Tax=Desulfonatronovibrio hydrogenovorans TaxID=53245 RepID=UPI0005551206|nr:nucleotide exchange factor GrpE [Desulfonatronovibrio hydrogenovorans]
MAQDRDKLEKEELESKDNGRDSDDEKTESEISLDDLQTLCEEHICPQCELLAEQKDKTLRALADSENYKKRLTREKEEFCKFAVSSFVEEILPVLDNLELALEHGQKNPACKDLVQGVEMTMSMFRQILEKNNLVQVGQIGEEFNPGLHEALAQEERSDMENGLICQVMQKGYVLNDRLIRPAKVMVSKKCPQ